MIAWLSFSFLLGGMGPGDGFGVDADIEAVVEHQPRRLLIGDYEMVSTAWPPNWRPTLAAPALMSTGTLQRPLAFSRGINAVTVLHAR